MNSVLFLSSSRNFYASGDISRAPPLLLQNETTFVGSTSCICSDKTGTLTQNIMTVAQMVYFDNTDTPAIQDAASSFSKGIRTYDPFLEAPAPREPKTPNIRKSQYIKRRRRRRRNRRRRLKKREGIWRVRACAKKEPCI